MKLIVTLALLSNFLNVQAKKIKAPVKMGGVDVADCIGPYSKFMTEEPGAEIARAIGKMDYEFSLFSDVCEMYDLKADYSVEFCFCDKLKHNRNLLEHVVTNPNTTELLIPRELLEQGQKVWGEWCSCTDEKRAEQKKHKRSLHGQQWALKPLELHNSGSLRFWHFRP